MRRPSESEYGIFPSFALKFFPLSPVFLLLREYVSRLGTFRIEHHQPPYSERLSSTLPIREHSFFGDILCTMVHRLPRDFSLLLLGDSACIKPFSEFLLLLFVVVVFSGPRQFSPPNSCYNSFASLLLPHQSLPFDRSIIDWRCTLLAFPFSGNISPIPGRLALSQSGPFDSVAHFW